MIDHHYPGSGFIRVRDDTLRALELHKARGAPDLRRLRSRICSDGSAVIDELVESLLYEGYALYPYTPGATKNATPTPFGIVYPPATRPTRHFDHLQVQCLVAAPPASRRRPLPAGERRAARGRATPGSA